jgi:proteasome lid subunit RPN8/RPN11
MRILFSPEAKKKMDLYVKHSDVEVSGLGKVKYLGQEEFLVENVLLFEQESNWGSTELSQEALARFLEDLLAKGEDPAEYRLFWHSHVDFPCFFSKVDERTIAQFRSPWLISVVANQKGEMRGRIDVFEPVHLFRRDKVIVDVYLEASDDEVKAIKEELKEKVKHKTFCYFGEARGWNRRDWWSDWWEVDDDDDTEDEDQARFHKAAGDY